MIESFPQILIVRHIDRNDDENFALKEKKGGSNSRIDRQAYDTVETPGRRLVPSAFGF